MTRKTLGTLLVVLMVLAVPLMAASPALASETVAFDGAAADSADQTNTTYIATNTGLDNVTVQMTEDQSVSAGSSIVFNTSATAASAEINSSSGTGTLDATVNDDNITIEETGGTDSATLESLNITFNVTADENETGVDVSSAMPNGTDGLVEDPDASEEHHYQVYDPAEVVDVDYEVVDADLEFNESAGELEANGSDATGQFVFEVTRNETTYEDIPLDSLTFDVVLNTTYFSDINEQTTESVDTLVLEDIASEGDDKVYTWSIVEPNNDTRTYEVAVNATAESGDANETLVHSNSQNPNGGVESSADTSYNHALSSGVIAPNFFDIGEIGIVGAVIGVVVVGGLVFFLYRDRDPMMGARGYGAYTGGGMLVAWVLLVALGLSMVLDFLDPLGFTFDFWTDLLANYDLMVLNDWTTLLGGIVVLVVAVGLNAANSDPMR